MISLPAMLITMLFAFIPIDPIPITPIFSPTPYPTMTPGAPTPFLSTPVMPPSGGLIDFLATAERGLQDGENQMATANAALPTQNSRLFIGYAKWIVSPTTAQEVFGPFAPIIAVIGTVIVILLVLALVYLFITIAVLIIRFIIWIITQVLKLIPFMGMFVLQVPPTPLPDVPNDLPTFDFPRVWDLAPDAVQTWNNFGDATQALQAIVLALLVALGLYMLYRFFRRMTSDWGE